MGELVLHPGLQQHCPLRRGIHHQRLVKALPDVTGRTPADGGVAIDTKINVVEMPLLHRCGGLFDRQELHPAAPESLAGRLQRTGEAGGTQRSALQGAEVHHSLVERGRFRGR